MKVYRSLADINIDFETSVALGNFDGVHIGHQKILKSAVKLAAKLGVRPACFTFSNHPRELFGKTGGGVLFIANDDEKLQLFEEAGIEVVFDVPFDEVTMNKGLKPYYMYRQKNSFQWGENLGYALDNCESIYNIEMIEENKTIIGIGAGAITKLIWQDEMLKKDNIKRIVNPKDPLVWMNELDERLEKKKGEIKKLFKR